MFHMPYCHEAMAEIISTECALRTTSEEQPQWEKGQTLPLGQDHMHQGATRVLFFLLFWQAKLKSLVTQASILFQEKVCPFHTGPLKPKLLPNYSDLFLLSVVLRY